MHQVEKKKQALLKEYETQTLNAGAMNEEFWN